MPRCTDGVSAEFTAVRESAAVIFDCRRYRYRMTEQVGSNQTADRPRLILQTTSFFTATPVRSTERCSTSDPDRARRLRMRPVNDVDVTV